MGLTRDVRTDPHVDHNDNGTWFCNVCRMIIILFDDDHQHDCTNHYPWEQQPEEGGETP